jgi:hypothetical protein
MQGPIGYKLSPLAEEATQLLDDIESGLYHEAIRLRQIIEVMDVEIESRGAAMQRLNKILGYDNSDGKHSTPTPEELLKKLADDAWKYRQLAGLGQS